MAGNEQGKAAAKRSFWQTLPGILTASAALLGAISSLLTILITSGVLDFDSNDPPLAATLIDQSGQELAELRYPAGEAFSDPDEEALAFSATLASGNALPDWIWIDPASGEIQARPQRGDAGTYAVTVTAADPAGATAAASFALEVAAAAARRAKVRVSFRRIELHDMKEGDGEGEIWLQFQVNGKRLRWPAKNAGYKGRGHVKMKKGETKSIGKSLEVTVAEGGRVEVFANAVEWDAASAGDPLGNVTRGYRVDDKMGTSNPVRAKSTCPKGCFTLHYDVGKPQWLN